MNYVPSDGWWYCWSDWRIDSIRSDLEAIAALGCDHIRIHCLWPLFQPNPSMVSSTMIDHLGELLDEARSTGLDVIVTVLDGWLSGFDFRPAWLMGANLFTDERALAAERRLIGVVAEAVRDHPAFLGFDVANEPSVLADEPQNVLTAREADHWAWTLLQHCSEVAPGGLHSIGMDHRPWITADSSFGRVALADSGCVTPIHAWTWFTGALDRYGAAATGTRHLAEYMLETARAWSTDPHRPVWLQEFGVAPGWMTNDDALAYVSATIRSAHEVQNVWGITWWCSHDIDRALTGFADLEYDLGLLTVDNTVKPTGRRFSEVVADLTAHPPQPSQRTAALVLPQGETPDLAFADRFFELIDAGIRPAIVLEERTDDREYLAERGITSLIGVGAAPASGE